MKTRNRQDDAAGGRFETEPLPLDGASATVFEIGATMKCSANSARRCVYPRNDFASPASAPLTSLTEDEILFRDNIRQFAEDKVRPLVKEMDEKGVFEKDLLHDFFQLGLMGIEIPEEYGGSGAKFFEAILAVEEMSRVDASSGVIVDVQNTLVNNALLRWGNADQKKRYLPKMASERVGAYALSEAGSGSDAFALQTRAVLKLGVCDQWPQALDHERQRSWIVRAVCDDRSGSGIQRDHRISGGKGFPRFTVGKKEDKLGIRASSTCELILEDCRVPKENVLGEAGKGYKIAIETLNEGRIGIGAQMIGLARGAWEFACKYAVERKQFGKAIADSRGYSFRSRRWPWRLKRRG